MPLAYQSSIRDYASKKPFKLRADFSHASTGSFNDIVFTCNLYTTYEITGCYYWFTLGTFSGMTTTGIYDGSTRYVVQGGTGVALNTLYGSVCEAPIEANDQWYIYDTVATATGNLSVVVVGWQYQRGQGGLD